MKKFNLKEITHRGAILAAFHYLMRWDFEEDSRYAIHSAWNGNFIKALTENEANEIFFKRNEIRR